MSIIAHLKAEIGKLTVEDPNFDRRLRDILLHMTAILADSDSHVNSQVEGWRDDFTESMGGVATGRLSSKPDVGRRLNTGKLSASLTRLAQQKDIDY
jgi:hypothetical protein